ncbi:MAG: phosphomannomutase/phosphoglucomutase [Clostridia bacterium]
MKIDENIKPNIFRGYDIRGIYGEELTEDVAYTIGKSYGTYIQNVKNKKVAIVGYDNRSSSVPLSKALIQGMVETGLDVINIGLVTTPMFYYSWLLFNVPSGIMITASHNPKEYNGFKMAFDEFGNACGEMIQDFRKHTANLEFIAGNGTERKEDITEKYLELLQKSINLGDKKIKVVVDAANGTASIVAKKAFELIGAEVIPIYCDSNPDFPNHHPDPCVEANNADLKKAVLANKADLGIGLDGDGDRVGVIDENGKMIFIDEFMIIIWRNIMSKVTNRNALFDIKCSKSLPDEILKLGGTPVFYRTGNSYMKAKMKEGKFAFGGELSGHVFFADKFPGFDDGIYAGMRLIEILSNTDKKLSEHLDGINKYYSTPEIKYKSTDDKKFGIIDGVRKYCEEKGYNIITLDGVRAEFKDGWALVRASNTGPDITMRFEGKTQERMKEIQDEFTALLP